jgi:hypothetical protein
VFTREDFIIKASQRSLFEKEVQHINYNISTNGLNSMEQNLIKNVSSTLFRLIFTSTIYIVN